ncbi:hypothetical protein ACHAXA_011164 [Cyclostephanos tholiformis]|uniref:Uncharacterized protein n=1 Tax=Cyclostephanos tholiformis TaxID=382380 RepID=A0ABD3R2X3_9STRA
MVFMSTALRTALLGGGRIVGDGSPLLLLFTSAICIFGTPALYYLYKYRISIKRKVEEMELRIRVVRNRNNNGRRRVICMELDPTFATDNPEWRVMSLGEYLTQLELPKDENNNEGKSKFRKKLDDVVLRKELEIAVGDVLMKTLGRTYGAALLPMLGMGTVAASIGGISDKISKYIAGCILLSDDEEGEDDAASKAVDRMSFDLTLMEVVSFINIYQKTFAPPTNDDDDPSSGIIITPLEYLRRGEKLHDEDGKFAYEFPTSTFDMNDFHEYVNGMEKRILEKEGGKYDPNDTSYPPPKPIHPRLLPDLYLGNGDLSCTHTKREGLEHRLICVLLNRLCHNYHVLSSGGGKNTLDNCFVVTCAGERCIFPEGLLNALVKCGHVVEVCPRAIMTNFGMQLCVKEEDGSYTYVPTALFLRTGIDSTTSGAATYFASPHGGMDLNISGPIVGRRGMDKKHGRPACVQFYVSINGLCCFHPDEDVDAPWRAKTSLCEIYTYVDAMRAIRMCAIVAVVFSRIATEHNLPFGGYGILGMCNDSSTIVDYALRGITNAYPLLSTGRYLNHIVSHFATLMEELRERIVDVPALEPVMNDILCLIRGTSRLPSDLHISPLTLIDTSRRHDATFGTPVFQNTADAKIILGEMADIARKYTSMELAR